MEVAQHPSQRISRQFPHLDAKLHHRMTLYLWPIVVLVIALFFMVMYRKPLNRLLDRTSKISATGLEASAAAQETAIGKKTEGAEELLAHFENELLVDREKAILQQLDSRHISSPVERERVLVRHLAAAVLYAHFDSCYRLAFGSQLSLLQELNASSSSLKEAVQVHYELAKMMLPDFYSDYSFDQWLHFLTSRTLARTDGDYVSITVAGREFLKFIVQEGRSFSKHG